MTSEYAGKYVKLPQVFGERYRDIKSKGAEENIGRKSESLFIHLIYKGDMRADRNGAVGLRSQTASMFLGDRTRWQTKRNSESVV